MKLTALLLIMSINLFGQALKMPDNPLEGRLVFEDKGCLQCHSLSGYGGNDGPDLMKQQFYGSFGVLASLIWNHIPKMNRMFRKLHRERPFISNEDMVRLVGFIYYLHYLGQPGSVSHGKALLRKKGCLNCHSIKGTPDNSAPDFSEIEFNTSPLYMIQTMWNHFPKMSRKLFSKNKRFPKLHGKDIVDISSYIQTISPKTVNTKMTPGNPNNGEKVFRLKGCLNCHDADDIVTEKAGPSLKRLKLHLSVTEIGALMWNHADSMQESMSEEQIAWPTFKNTEMADLIAYLYFLDFQDTAGNPLKGESVFEDKKCITCHGSDDDIGPNLANGFKFKSPVQMITKMWNHSAEMEDEILSSNENWPKLTADDFINLYAFFIKKRKKTTKQ